MKSRLSPLQTLSIQAAQMEVTFNHYILKRTPNVNTFLVCAASPLNRGQRLPEKEISPDSYYESIFITCNPPMIKYEVFPQDRFTVKDTHIYLCIFVC